MAPLAALKNSFALSAILAAACAGLFAWQMVQLIRAEDWLDHTDRAISKVFLIEKVMIDAETGIRGFLLSDRRALAPYEAALAAFPILIRDTQELVQDNPAQQSRLRLVADYFSEWSSVAAETVRHPDTRAGKAYFALGRGSQLMDLSRKQLLNFVSEENGMREARARHLRWLIPRAIAGGAAVSLMLRLLLNLMLRRTRG